MVKFNHRSTFSVTQEQLEPGSLLFSRVIQEWRHDIDQSGTIDCDICGGKWAPIIIVFIDGDEVEALLHRRLVKP